MLFIQHAIGHGHRPAGVCFARDVSEDLATLLVEAQDAWSLKARVLQIAEKSVDRGRPWTRSATDGIADTHGRIEIPTEGHLVAHARRRSEEHTSELQSPCNLVCRLLLVEINCCSR